MDGRTNGIKNNAFKLPTVPRGRVLVQGVCVPWRSPRGELGTGVLLQLLALQLQVFDASRGLAA